MTNKDDHLGLFFQQLSFNDTHQEQQLQQKFQQKYQELQQLQEQLHQLQQPQQEQHQTPFQIVLIDIRAAAKQKIIRCVEKPLFGDKDLKFVALSYRWGELNEAFVETECGYVAKITSFELIDFFKICWMMTEEADLKSINYVWVDAICVDQSNYERRKTTIHEMSNIYDRATYILAVPDLHLQHLWAASSSNRENIKNAKLLGEYIFQLIHGNKRQLLQLKYDNVKKPDGSFMSVSEAMDRIKRSVRFLADLVKDWSTRVWVVSEYNIAKQKQQKMKYWFIQLGNHFQRNGHLCHENQNYSFRKYSFFQFDFSSTSKNSFRLNFVTTPTDSLEIRQSKSELERIYKNFHSTIIGQLDQQTFLERILKSKASKNEDRFHAIMPSSKYKRIIENKDVVDGWKIDNLVSVKLKLYEVMDTKDKLKLFFLSCTTDSLNFSADILPTFATSNIDWPFRFQDNVPPFGMKHGAVNFDLTSVSTIHLIRMNDGYSKLNLKPLQYAVITCGMANYLITEFRRTRKPQCKQLGLNVPNTPISVVYIPICQFTARKKTEEGNVIEIEDHILLVGSFERNKWVLQCPQRRQRISEDDILRHCLDDDPGFDIY